MRACSLAVAICLSCLPVAAQSPEQVPDDLLTLAKGAVLVSASVDPAKALALTDGNAASNWSTSTKKFPPPYTFVFELIAPASLTHVGIDGSGERPGGVVGGSAGPVLIEGSAEGPETGFTELARIMAAPEGPTLGDVATDAPVRWLRFTVEGAQTETAWIYFDEVIAHGDVTPPDEADRFTGIFQTARANFLELKQDGASLTGCYTENSGRSQGRLTGSVVEGVALLNWTSDKGITGTAFLTRDHEGALAGVNYRQRSRRAWAGPVAPEGTTTPCSDAPPENALANDLADDGIARLYGILFEHDSDVPKPSSAAALNQLLEVLQSDASLSVEIQGHTDADGADGYNLDLSDRRARSVVAWLVENGISADRLQGAGKGESDPVASNDTADGKALNRRVEVRRL